MDKCETGLQMKYFVLKPKGDDEYAKASRKAIFAYSNEIASTNQQLAVDLLAWVREDLILDNLSKMETEEKGDG